MENKDVALLFAIFITILRGGFLVNSQGVTVKDRILLLLQSIFFGEKLQFEVKTLDHSNKSDSVVPHAGKGFMPSLR